MPHITEEIWHGLWQKDDQEFLALQPYPQALLSEIDEDLESEFKLLFSVIRVMRNLRAEAEIKPSQKVKFFLQSENEKERTILQTYKNELELLGKGEEVEVIAMMPEAIGQTMTGIVDTVQVVLPLKGVIDLAQVKAKIERSLKKIEPLIIAIENRLQNPSYLEKAPPEKIATDRAELEEYRYQIRVLEERLHSLADEDKTE
jgi:valyl-tRNA synthetase